MKIKPLCVGNAQEANELKLVNGFYSFSNNIGAHAPGAFQGREKTRRIHARTIARQQAPIDLDDLRLDDAEQAQIRVRNAEIIQSKPHALLA